MIVDQFPMTLFVNDRLGRNIISNQKGCGRNVATAKAVDINSLLDLKDVVDVAVLGSLW